MLSCLVCVPALTALDCTFTFTFTFIDFELWPAAEQSRIRGAALVELSDIGRHSRCSQAQRASSGQVVTQGALVAYCVQDLSSSLLSVPLFQPN